jgi:hypothetical protein
MSGVRGGTDYATRILWGVFFRGSFTMTDRRRDLALAIKSCLDSLAEDAANNDMVDLARFVGLAALAAEEAAQAADPHSNMLKALMAGEAGHC